MTIKIGIVIPAFNGEAYIASAMTSILCQDGNYHVHIHVQDGGSTDRTAQIAQETFKLCNQFSGYKRTCSFSIETTPDKSIYDAVCKGFDHISLSSQDIMTWLGVDDILNSGTLSSISNIFGQMPDVEWVTGDIQLYSRENGFYTNSNIGNNGQSKFTLENGWNDGRTYWFIQQEGTFWRRSLWDKVTGINLSYKLAGDWDLWRRFADHALLYRTKNLALGMFGVRKGQLSENLDPYYSEVGSIKRFTYSDCQSLIKNGNLAPSFTQENFIIQSANKNGWDKAHNRYEPCIRPTYGLPHACTDREAQPRWAESNEIQIIASSSGDGKYYLIVGYKNQIKDLRVTLNHNDHTDHKTLDTYEYSEGFNKDFHILPLSITQKHIKISMTFNKSPLLENGEPGLLFDNFILVPRDD